MIAPRVSVVIPSHNDRYLRQTIASLLDNAAGTVEIVVTLDGYEPNGGLPEDPRVRAVRHLENRGMREAINSAVTVTWAPWILRTDEHCMFAPGWDAALLEEIELNWIVVPRRYKLDPVRWERTADGPIDYEKLLVIEKPDGVRKFSAVEWKSRARERAAILVDETMAFQGSCWLMSRFWWDCVIGRLDSEGYGPLYQDTTEMLFKTWAAGGRLMVCKKTWYAHKHRSFNRTHHYPLTRAIPEWEFALQKHAAAYEEVRARWGV